MIKILKTVFIFKYNFFGFIVAITNFILNFKINSWQFWLVFLACLCCAGMEKFLSRKENKL